MAGQTPEKSPKRFCFQWSFVNRAGYIKAAETVRGHFTCTHLGENAVNESLPASCLIDTPTIAYLICECLFEVLNNKRTFNLKGNIAIRYKTCQQVLEIKETRNITQQAEITMKLLLMSGLILVFFHNFVCSCDCNLVNAACWWSRIPVRLKCSFELRFSRLKFNEQVCKQKC